MTLDEISNFNATIEYFNERINHELNKNNPDIKYIDKLTYLRDEFQKFLDNDTALTPVDVGYTGEQEQ